MHVFFFRSIEKMALDGPKWGREGLFPANPDLADILGDMDLDFAFFLFLLDSKFLDFQVPRFPESGLGLCQVPRFAICSPCR